MPDWFGRDARRRRIEDQAYSWVVKIDGDRSKHEAALREWIGSDSERAEIYNRARRSFRRAAGPAEAIYGNMRQRGSVASARGVRAIPYRQLIVFAAGLILFGFALSFAISVLTGRITQAPPHSVSLETLATRVGEVRSVRLSDGSRIVLDTNSHVEVHFTREARLLSLTQGRARFEVAHNASWPFIVAAGGGTVTARGTVFDVDVANAVAVNLISGVIDVRLPTTMHNEATVRHLQAGQKLVYSAAQDRSDAQPTPARASDGQWISGMETFDDVPVREILDEANRYTSRRIVLQDPAIGDREVFLDVEIRNPLAVAQKLADLLKLRVDDTRPDVIELTRDR